MSNLSRGMLYSQSLLLLGPNRDEMEHLLAQLKNRPVSAKPLRRKRASARHDINTNARSIYGTDSVMLQAESLLRSIQAEDNDMDDNENEDRNYHSGSGGMIGNGVDDDDDDERLTNTYSTEDDAWIEEEEEDRTSTTGSSTSISSISGSPSPVSDKEGTQSHLDVHKAPPSLRQKHSLHVRKKRSLRRPMVDKPGRRSIRKS